MGFALHPRRVLPCVEDTDEANESMELFRASAPQVYVPGTKQVLYDCKDHCG